MEIRQAETAAKPEIYIEHDPLAEEQELGMEETEASEEDSASGDEPVRMVFAGLFQIPSGSHMVNPGLIQGIAGIQKGVHTKIKRMVICQGHKVKPQFLENPHPLRRKPEGKLLILWQKSRSWGWRKRRLLRKTPLPEMNQYGWYLQASSRFLPAPTW